AICSFWTLSGVDRFPNPLSLTTYCVCLELRSLPSPGVTRAPRCRVGGGGAFTLPPSARSNGSCRFPPSRFPVWTPRGRQEHSDAGHQADQTYESQFRHQPSGRILAISGVPPSLGNELSTRTLFDGVSRDSDHGC